MEAEESKILIYLFKLSGQNTLIDLYRLQCETETCVRGQYTKAYSIL